MSQFDPAFRQIMIEEGGDAYTETPGDLGGATKWGITIPAAQGFWGKDRVSGPGFIRSLTSADAHAFYLDLWTRSRVSGIQDQTSATKCFSALVNMGGNGIKCAQRAAGALDDGALGTDSLAAINATTGFIEDMAMEMEAFYRGIVERRPGQAKFLKGWLRRARWGCR